MVSTAALMSSAPAHARHPPARRAQDEADTLRGYPADQTKTDVMVVNLGVGGHVALHGAAAETAPI